MKTFALVAKILAALAAAAGVVFIVATYGDKIVAWCKEMLAKCPCANPVEAEPVAEEVVAEEAVAEEVAAEEPVAEEVVVEEAPVEAPAAEEPIAEEADFAE